MHSGVRPFKFIHAADVHLDTPYRRHNEALRRRLQEAGQEAFVALVGLAINEQVDALLIAGDLFDNNSLTIATERLLSENLAKLTGEGITVVYVTGNHDPGRANYRAAQIKWPKTGFHLHNSRRPQRIPIHRLGEPVGWVVGAGHQTTNESTNLAAAFPLAPGPQPAVALLHADVGGAQGAPDDETGNTYAPAGLSDLNPSYAYWALGHIHRRQRLREDSPAWYPGNLQGRDFGETGAKGALLVEVNQWEPPQVRFRPLARVRWERLGIDDLSSANNILDVQSAVRMEFHRVQESDGHLLPQQEWILRVELSGPCPLASVIRADEERDELAEYLRQSLGALDVEVRDAGLHPPVQLDQYRGRPHVLGEALNLIDQARTDDTVLSRLSPEELALADKHPDGSRRLAYLRDLLVGLDVAAAERLLRDDSQ